MAEAAGTGAVLARLAHPYDPPPMLAALIGVPLRVARQIVGQALATSAEAEGLLHAMPRILRSMAIATTDQPERCYGELRGPVLWSETMSARSASAGDPGLFVCATTTKAYDTDENRVLKAALAAVAQAGRAADMVADDHASDDLRRARHNGHTASRLLEHQTLAAVPVGRPNGRQLRRTRAGSRRNTYQPALALLRRAEDPLRAADVVAHAQPGTVAQLDLLAATLMTVEAHQGTPVLLRRVEGRVVGGPVAYDHLVGVVVHDRLVTTPAEARTALEQTA